jgi:outer membrane protein
LKLIVVAAALAFTLAATPGFAQTPPRPAPPRPTPPAGQTPPATPPGQQAPAVQPPAARPPAPFPQGAKYAFVDIQEIASSSDVGKESSTKLKALNDKKVTEINEKNKQLTALQTKLNTGGSVLSEASRSQLEKDIDKLQRDIQFSQQNAQAELNDLQNELQADFQKRLLPVIEQVAQEKGLHMVFSLRDSGIAWADPGLDISQDVIKRLNGPATKKE